MIAWHWTGDTLRDGRPIPPAGTWLTHDGPVEMCESGLHASERLLNAMRFAPDLRLHRVELDDVVDRADDKLVARRRRIVASYDVPLERVVRFACEAAGLAAFAAGLDLPELIRAAEAADGGDWQSVEDAGAARDARAAWAAWAAGAAWAARAAWAAAGAAAGVAWAALEKRAVALFTGAT